MVKLSIQIVTYNSAERLIKTLNAIYQSITNISYEIIVVDNASIDSTKEIIEKEFPNIVLIKNEKNLFFSPAQNQASKLAKGEYILILNSDISLYPDTIQRLVNFLDKTHEVGCVAPQILSDHRREVTIWRRRTNIQIIRSKAPFVYFVKRYNWSIIPYKFNNINGEMCAYGDVVSDACLLIRKRLLYEIGGYNEKMKMYFTEDFLSFSVRNKGYKVASLNSVFVHHEGGHSTKKENKLFIQNLERKDRYIFFNTHIGSLSAIFTYVLGILEYMYLFSFQKILGRIKKNRQ
jgi:GT2 family glycosyltransferase